MGHVIKNCEVATIVEKEGSVTDLLFSVTLKAETSFVGKKKFKL